MFRKFAIRTEKGKLDSLRESVQLFFTLTPVESNRSGQVYSVIPRRLPLFQSNVDSREEFGWGAGFYFCLYEFTGNEKKDAVFSIPSRKLLSPGECATMVSRETVQWGEKKAYDPSLSNQPAVVAKNNSGVPQRVCLAVKGPLQEPGLAIALYNPIENGDCIIAPSDLVLQIYAADASKGLGDASKGLGRVLQPEDFSRPLFPIPLSCDTLPETATWKLTQDRHGEIKLVNDDHAKLGTHSIQTLARSISDMHDRLSLLFKSVHDTQQRISSIEQSLTSNQAELSVTRNDLSTMRDQLSHWDRTLPAVATKAPELESRLTCAENRVADVEKAAESARASFILGQQTLGATQSQLMAMEKLSELTKSGLSMVQVSLSVTMRQVSALDEKVPILEHKVSRMETVISDRQQGLPTNAQERSDSPDRPSTTRKSIDFAPNHPSNLERHIPMTESRADKSDMKNPTPLVAADPPPARSTARDHMPGSDSRNPVIELKVEELERSVEETKKDMSYVRKLLRTRFTALESKAETMGTSIGRVQGDISEMQRSRASSREQLDYLGARVAIVEERVDDLVGSLGEMGVGPQDNQPSSRRSPLLFPSQVRESRVSTPSPSQEARFFGGGDSDASSSA